MKFAWAEAKNFEDADVVLFGVPDESGSHALRKGVARAPQKIRQITNHREIIRRPKSNVFYQPQHGILNKNIFDLGDVKKAEAEATAARITKAGKVPVCVGGDHSITFELLKGISSLKKKVSVVYFDSHPDFVCSEHRYYGSVMCDARKLEGIDLKKSVLVGMRSPEPEEFTNMKQEHLTVISGRDYVELDAVGVLEKILKTVGKNVYVSIDMDVVDPAFAPGVDTPVPGGLTSADLVYLTTEIAERGIIGFDVMEVSPKFDIQDMTTHLAARLIVETIHAIK